MSKFLVIHKLDTPITLDEKETLVKKCMGDISMDAYWVKSWLKLNENNEITAVFCEWEANNELSIRNLLKQCIPELPISEISNMMEVTINGDR